MEWNVSSHNDHRTQKSPLCNWHTTADLSCSRSVNAAPVCLRFVCCVCVVCVLCVLFVLFVLLSVLCWCRWRGVYGGVVGVAIGVVGVVVLLVVGVLVCCDGVLSVL